MQAAKFYKTLKDQAVQCELCPRQCRLKPGQAGLCKTRVNNNGKLYSLTYGKPVAVNVDPIEKKPLYHVYPGEKIFSFGTFGCNLKCKHCQNCDLSQSDFIEERTLPLPPKKVIQLTHHYEACGIAFTYNEPSINAEYVMDTAALAKSQGFITAMVTNGYISPAAAREVYKNTDAANIDLKAFNKEFYEKIVGGKLEPVLEAIRTIYDMGVWVELTTLVIPGLNDSPREIENLSKWVVNNLSESTPLHLTAFHPAYRLTHIPATRPSQLLSLREVARQSGLNFVYTGNISHQESATTYCNGCGRELIIRNWYKTEIRNLTGNTCKNCGTRLPGIFPRN
ncbi:MAG: AmmeMemoRadiSam system radical SAM enzyme [Calditrichia bacterium]